jgi:hypothetical protein
VSRRSAVAATWIKDPIPTFVLLNVLVQGILMSSVVGTETGAQYAVLRYLPHLIVFGPIVAFVLVSELVHGRVMSVSLCAVAVCLNILALSFWARPSGRTVPVSWVRPVYSEILWPQESAWEEMLQKLRTQSQGPNGSQTLLLGLPVWTQEILIFYVGDQYLVRPILSTPSEEIEHVLRSRMGQNAFAWLRGQPDWLVDSLNVQRDGPMYLEVANIPSHRSRPDDGARPELTRHAFAGPEAVRSIRLFRRQQETSR